MSKITPPNNCVETALHLYLLNIPHVPMLEIEHTGKLHAEDLEFFHIHLCDSVKTVRDLEPL